MINDIDEVLEQLQFHVPNGPNAEQLGEEVVLNMAVLCGP